MRLSNASDSADSLEPAWDSLSAPPTIARPSLSLSLSLSNINKLERKTKHTFPWICPQDFLERPLDLVFDGGQTETGILGCNDLMF